MRELKTEIFLSAPIDQVWKTLTDFEHWKDWNPTVKDVKGRGSLREKLSITMARDDCKEMTYQAEVVETEAPKTFRWRAKMMAGFIFTNDRIFSLQEKDGGTLLTHTEAYSGIMAMISWGKLNEFVIPLLEKMNQALKDKLEGNQKAAEQG